MSNSTLNLSKSESPCDTYFSVSNLAGSSLETEMYQTQLCVPNQLKLALYTIYVAINSSLLLYSIYLFFRFKHRINRTIYVKCMCGLSCNIALQALFIGGSFNRYRFLLIGVYNFFYYFASDSYIKIWHKFIMDSAIQIGIREVSKFHLVSNIGIPVVNTINSINVIVFVIGATVCYDNPVLLNLFCTLYTTVSILTGAFISFFFVYAGKHVITACKPMLSDDLIRTSDQVTNFLAKITSLTASNKVYGIVELMAAVGPIVWYLASSQHNLNGFFYCYYFLLQPFMAICMYTLLYGITYDRNHKNTSSNGNESHSSSNNRSQSAIASTSGGGGTSSPPTSPTIGGSRTHTNVESADLSSITVKLSSVNKSYCLENNSIVAINTNPDDL